MATYFTADPHFGHHNIIKFCNRPFANIDEMDEVMIERWNQRVRESSDDVYVVGDFANWHDQKRMQRVFSRLNGRKHLIIGNHDGRATLRLPWSSPPRDRLKLTVDDQVFILDHYAQRSWDRMYRGSWHVYGHCHDRLPGVGRSTDVGVDAWDFYPTTPAEVMERIKMMNPDMESYAPETGAVRGTPRGSVDCSVTSDDAETEPPLAL